MIAGAESRNVSAAAAGTPRDTSRPAIGTDPHSQPGSAAPATAAHGTASTGLSGISRGSSPAGTNASIAALIPMPSTRNGMAATAIATKIVAQWATAGRSSRSIEQRTQRRSRDDDGHDDRDPDLAAPALGRVVVTLRMNRSLFADDLSHRRRG